MTMTADGERADRSLRLVIRETPERWTAASDPPRYEVITRSSFRTTSGVPRTTTEPWSRAMQLVGDGGDQGHVVFDDQDRAPSLVADAAQQRRQPLGLGLGNARRRLVEEQHLRFGGQHARQVGDAPETGRQLLHELVPVRLEAHQLDEVLGPAPEATLSPPGPGRADRRQRCALDLEPLLQSDEQRLEDGEAREQPGVLEPPDQPEPAALVRGHAADVLAGRGGTGPRSAGTYPLMRSNSVVLPDPLGPMSPRTSPSRRTRSTSSTAMMPP